MDVFFFAFAVYLLQQHSHFSMNEQAFLCCKSLKSCLSRTDTEPLRVHSSCVTVVEMTALSRFQKGPCPAPSPAVTAQSPPQTVAEHSGFEGLLPHVGLVEGRPPGCEGFSGSASLFDRKILGQESELSCFNPSLPSAWEGAWNSGQCEFTKTSHTTLSASLIGGGSQARPTLPQSRLFTAAVSKSSYSRDRAGAAAVTCQPRGQNHKGEVSPQLSALRAPSAPGLASLSTTLAPWLDAGRPVLPAWLRTRAELGSHPGSAKMGCAAMDQSLALSESRGDSRMGRVLPHVRVRGG